MGYWKNIPPIAVARFRKHDFGGFQMKMWRNYVEENRDFLESLSQTAVGQSTKV